MKIIHSLAVLVFLALAATVGCSTAGSTADIPELTVDQVSQGLQTGGIVPVDANSASTRAEQGTLPHARLLSSCSRYDVAQELPGDKEAKLVFYCGSTQCTASDQAAARAVAAGYSDVSIMRAGIRGWREAGKPTAHPPQG